MQFIAVSSTFKEDTIVNFVEKIRGGINRNNLEQIELLINSLRYSGTKEFNDPDVLIEVAEHCFVTIGKEIEKEHRNLKSRCDYLDKISSNFKIGKLY